MRGILAGSADKWSGEQPEGHSFTNSEAINEAHNRYRHDRSRSTKIVYPRSAVSFTHSCRGVTAHSIGPPTDSICRK